MNYPMKTKQNSKTNKLLSISQLTIQVVTQVLNTFLTKQTFMAVGMVWRMNEAVDNAQTGLTQTTSIPSSAAANPLPVRKAKEHTEMNGK
jgi:hypothetical protein